MRNSIFPFVYALIAIYYLASILIKRFEDRPIWAKRSILVLSLFLFILSAFDFAINFHILNSSDFPNISFDCIKAAIIGFLLGVLFPLLTAGELIKYKNAA